MCQWHAIGYRLEAKFADESSIWVRNQGQRSEFPHLIICLDYRGKIAGVRPSDGRAAMGSLEGTHFILEQVKKILLENLEC